jgi:hypothetical protein
MPSSFVDSVAPIVKLLVDIDPQSVVDVGPGWGKYGLMCREYLPKLEIVDAVEVTQGRLPTQDVIYDNVFECDARTVAPAFWGTYDVALIIDVIEHMSLEEGRLLIRSMADQGCRALVSTPKVWMEQHDENNPFETHVSLWTWKEFLRGKYEIQEDVSTIDSIIYLLG